MDKRDLIIGKIREFFKHYPDVEVHMDFDRVNDQFLVTYFIPASLEDNKPFWDDLMSLKDDIRDNCQHTTVLFSESNDLFSLSDKALKISRLPKTTMKISSPNFTYSSFSSQSRAIPRL